MPQQAQLVDLMQISPQQPKVQQLWVLEEEVRSSSKHLFMGFSGFNTINASTREELIQTTAALEVVGVSAELTANSVDFLTKALGSQCRRSCCNARKACGICEALSVLHLL